MAERLLADIGGTHSRLAVAGDGGISGVRIYDNAGFAGLEPVIDTYLEEQGGSRPAAAALAVACPVAGDSVTLTNLGWTFGIEALRRRFGWQSLHVVNDFVAVALAVPSLEPGDVRRIGGGTAVSGRPVAVIGPGTGLGVSALVPRDGDWIPVAGEGGHVTLAPADDEESRLLAALRRDLGHVSAERLLSGAGLVRLYRLLAGTDAAPDAAAITRRAAAGDDPVAVQVLAHFFAMLGTAAGNLALTLGAQGGVYLAGGILPRLPDLLEASPFRERFVDKGRYRDYLQAIPTFLITREQPALLGLEGYARRQAAGR